VRSLFAGGGVDGRVANVGEVNGDVCIAIHVRLRRDIGVQMS